MKTILNRNLLENTNFTSDTLSPFSFLVHSLVKAGTYSLEIYENNRLVYTNQIISANENNETGLNIDLHLNSLSSQKGSFLINGDHAYLLFYNSQAFTKNRVVIKDKTNIVFDSNTPKKGDLFILNLLKPGEYILKSNSLKTSMKLNVLYPDLKRDKVSDSLTKINLDAKSIREKDSQPLLPNQGIVIQLGDGLNDFNIEHTKGFDSSLENSVVNELKILARSRIKTSTGRSKKQIIKRFSTRK
ncbi:hypothetical protein [Perlabentimonas gracilis]|uniref:hypothetical protein n=1 Tax=Perlabentimonas gracilis TaxID=2715279 RepID=UPI00140B135E|nr:hypothetical protein [Perlabentimonas gracilis]NHB69804.1 hypothetical protein [Perlabentimonas gracilis]